MLCTESLVTGVIGFSDTTGATFPVVGPDSPAGTDRTALCAGILSTRPAKFCRNPLVG